MFHTYGAAPRTESGRTINTREGSDDHPSAALPLDVHFVNTLPVPAALCHSRESGNPGDERYRDWMPACAGMTFYWRRTYETDI